MKKSNIKGFIFLAIILVTLVSPLFAFADQLPPGCETGKLCNPINVNSITGLVAKVLEFIIKIGIPIIAVAIIYCGFLFVFALGNSEKLKKAKSALLYTLIGAAILLGSWAIAELIRDTVSAL